MDSIPPNVLPSHPPLNGQLDLFTLAAFVALFVILGMTVWQLWRLNRAQAPPRRPARPRRGPMVFGSGRGKITR